jgi:hypothetical protein
MLFTTPRVTYPSMTLNILASIYKVHLTVKQQNLIDVREVTTAVFLVGEFIVVRWGVGPGTRV